MRELYTSLRASPPIMAIGSALARFQPKAHYVGEDTVLLRTVFGQKLYLNARDESLTPHLVLDGFWEKHVTRAFLKLVKPGCTVVEVGANVGYFTTLAAARVGPTGRVIAFEANPAVAELLERTLRVNGLAGRCTVVRQAAADTVGTAQFHCMEREQGNSSLRVISGSGPGVGVSIIEVPTTTLDAFFGEEGPRIDVLKIDAEGAEPLIFAGMERTLSRNPGMVIVMEFAREMIRQTTGDPEAFLRRIAALGYRSLLITPSGALRELSVAQLLGLVHCDVVLRRG